MERFNSFLSRLRRGEDENRRDGWLPILPPARSTEDGRETPEDPDAVIGRQQIREAEATLQKYKSGKAKLETRIIHNEEWYRLRHWESVEQQKAYDAGAPKCVSAWLFNALANKHADAMDNYPEPVVLPREASDEAAAKALSDVLPVVLEQSRFEQAYNDSWWDKLKGGTSVYGVFWDSSAQNGLGDIAVEDIDLINLFWEPGVSDIQQSRNLFHVNLVSNEVLQEQYPQIRRKLRGNNPYVAQYIRDDSVDTQNFTPVIDWYYKRRIEDGRVLLHYCKFCAGEVLYASENDPVYRDRGYYDHGKYPFVFDVLFPIKDSPAGFGYVDICANPQMYIDSLDAAILENAIMAGRNRFFVRGDGSIREEEYADWTNRFVHYSGGGNPTDSIMPVPVQQMSATAFNTRTAKIDELKETSGNRDFSQGGTSSGVTAASAIAALQEAGSKLSRDMLKSCYRAVEEVCTLCIELMRQFYTEPRYFRVTQPNGGGFDYVDASTVALTPQTQQGAFSQSITTRTPIFDVKVEAQKSSPFSTAAQNERAKELYSMGFFAPNNADQSLAALEMMEFEGIDKVRQRVAQNGTLYDQVMQMQEQMVKMAAIIDTFQPGTNMTGDMVAAFGQQGQQAIPGGSPRGETESNALGDAMRSAQSNTPSGARAAAARNATPK